MSDTDSTGYVVFLFIIEIISFILGAFALKEYAQIKLM